MNVSPARRSPHLAARDVDGHLVDLPMSSLRGTRRGRLPIRAFIIDEDALVRAGLRAFLTSAPDIDVIGEAPTGEDALAAVQAVEPDVIVIDVRAQGIEGVARRAASSDDAPRPHVIVLISTAFDEYLA